MSSSVFFLLWPEFSDRYSRQPGFGGIVAGGADYWDNFCYFPGVLYSYAVSAAAKIFDDFDHRLGTIFIGGFLCIFINPFEPSGHWDGAAVAAMVYLILGATVLSYSVFLVGLKVVGATKASLISCAEPLASIIAVVLWLKTPLTLEDLVGMTCIILTVVLLSLPKK